MANIEVFYNRNCRHSHLGGMGVPRRLSALRYEPAECLPFGESPRMISSPQPVFVRWLKFTLLLLLFLLSYLSKNYSIRSDMDYNNNRSGQPRREF